MKTRVLPFLFLLLGFVLLQAQSLDDLKKLETLKKELEKSGETLTPTDKSKVTTEIPSLQTFKDTLSTPIKAEPVKNEPAIPATEEVKTKPLPYFGYNVFTNAKVDFSPDIYGPVDENYPLGPGDELVISVWGEVELRKEVTINRNSQVYLENVGLITLSGLTVKSAKKELTKRLSKSYASIAEGKAFLDISVGKLRSIRVFVVGDVKAPGVFTVPALTDPFTMLFYAGGIQKNGSLRHIQLIRKQKQIKDLDFYDFLTKGEKYNSVRLQNNDVLLVPTVKKRVSLSGAVVQAGVFELKDSETLKDVIDLAGGFADNANPVHIQIKRYSNQKDKELININYTENYEFALQNGDQIDVSAISRDLENFVRISGPIFGPKRFAYYKGMTIKELFTKVDSIGGDAYLNRVHITRMLPDDKKQLFSINLNDFLHTPGQDFLLAPQDLIEIKSKNVLFPADSVHIFGAINEPGVYELKKDMTLKDLIFQAGGFRKDARITEAEVSRINTLNTNPNKIATILTVEIDSNYTKSIQGKEAELFFLEPDDDIFIRTRSESEMQRHIAISGEVKFPGTYSLISKTERITDVIKRAGGLKNTAYLEGAQLIRSNRTVGKIGIDFNKIFANPSSEQNIYVQAGDRIIIPERLATVKIVGGVNFPSSVLYERGRGLDYYIKSAGGYTDLADEDNVTVRLANGRPIHQKQFLFWRYISEEITAGSVIYVPVFAEKKEIDWSGAIRDAAAILSSVATVILIVDRVK